jgi:hypothetical protein
MQTIHLLMDISVIIIALQVFVILLVPAAILFLINKGVSYIPKLIRRYAPQVQLGFRRASEIAEQASEKIAAPVIEVEAWNTRLRRTWRSLF